MLTSLCTHTCACMQTNTYAHSHCSQCSFRSWTISIVLVQLTVLALQNNDQMVKVHSDELKHYMRSVSNDSFHFTSCFPFIQHTQTHLTFTHHFPAHIHNSVQHIPVLNIQATNRNLDQTRTKNLSQHRFNKTCVKIALKLLVHNKRQLLFCKL
jgi:hypothetical protein